MLVSAKEMLEKAKAGHYAVGQFNINNLEWTKSVLLTAEELQSPVILGVSEGAGKYMTGFGTVAAMVKAMMSLVSQFRLHFIWIMVHTKDATSASRLDSHPSCSTVPIIRSTRTLRRQKNSLRSLTSTECQSKQKLDPSVEKKMELSEEVSALIRKSVRE